MKTDWIYPRSRTPLLDLELFANPTAEYRGAPLWSWNAKLDREQLFRQIDYFLEMGIGGFHIHVRTGLETEYLGAEFFDLVRACVDKAESLGMKVWLYDEDRWPSGFAGGLVTKDPAYRARHLLFTRRPYGLGGFSEGRNLSAAVGRRNENGRLLARYEVVLENGCLKHYRLLTAGESAALEADEWLAYLETSLPAPWFNHQTYVDTLNPKAIERFVEITHERYAAAVGNRFRTTIPAIFTDEPQFVRKGYFREPEDIGDVGIPFTDDLFESYAKTYGQRLEDHLPELFWELPDGAASAVRYRYHDHVCERFTQAFSGTIGAWCENHQLALTGHMMEEPTLFTQTLSLGEAMRSYQFFDLPGIDILCDAHEYTTAKQAQSAARQYGREGVMSELYGVTGWYFDFTGHKGQGDWQAALGVTTRVHHLTWVSMGGEAKRDYPASIGYQSPWFREYRTVEDHFARLSVVLTRGKAQVRVGVIHPVESYWLCFGPLEQTAVERDQREAQFKGITEWLLFGLIDFDFICESLLPQQYRPAKAFQVGEMAYDTVIVPSMRTIRSSTLDCLEQFRDAGGEVIFSGEVPELVDALPSDRPRILAERCSVIAHARSRILHALEAQREIDVRQKNGSLADCLLHQIRTDGARRYVFLCNVDREKPRDETRIRIKGQWGINRMDTMLGTVHPLAVRHIEDWTEIIWSFPACGSLLLELEPGAGSEATAEPNDCLAVSAADRSFLDDVVPIQLSEPNVLLLDQAEWRLEGGEWNPLEEILRLDNLVRRSLGLSDRSEHIAQPWVDPSSGQILARVELRLTFEADHPVETPYLALEQSHNTEIHFNGEPVSSRAEGWWVDESIQKIPLPGFGTGLQELRLMVPFSSRAGLEACYLLGDFGVELRGRRARVTAPVRTLAIGDWTRQGLPFYPGNVTYRMTLQGGEEKRRLHVPKFKGALASASLNGQRIGALAFPPFELDLGYLPAGTHELEITIYGNRFNTFGSLHLGNEKCQWHSPNSYRTTEDDWSYEYLVKPMGLLTAPVILNRR